MKRINFILFALLVANISYAQRTSHSVKMVIFQAHIDASAVFTTKYVMDSYQTLTLAGPSLDATIGARITKYLYIGAGIGYHALMTKTTIGIQSTSPWYMPPQSRAIEDIYSVVVDALDYNHYIPMFLNLKTYLPISHKILPYADLSLGGYIGLHERAFYEFNSHNYNYKADRLPNGFYMRAGLGVDIMRVNVGVGYELLKNRIGSEHIGYVKLGWRFG